MRSSPCSKWLHACGMLRARCATSQCAENFVGSSVRSVGRKAPEKLGSGQSEVRLTDVYCATGANVNSEEPLNVSANLKSKALMVAGAGVAPDAVVGAV